MFVDDIVEAGADVLCFEPMTARSQSSPSMGRPTASSPAKGRAHADLWPHRADQGEIDATLPLARQVKGLCLPWATTSRAMSRLSMPSSTWITYGRTGGCKPRAGCCPVREEGIFDNAQPLVCWGAVWLVYTLGMGPFMGEGEQVLFREHLTPRISPGVRVPSQVLRSGGMGRWPKRPGCGYAVLTAKHHDGYCPV